MPKLPVTTHQWLAPFYTWLGKALAWVSTDADVVTTTGATATTIATLPLTAGKSYTFEALVTGTKSDGTQGMSAIIAVSYRNNGGTLSIIGTASSLFSAKDDGSWGDPAFSASGANLLLKVTGKASTTIKWGTTILKHSA